MTVAPALLERLPPPIRAHVERAVELRAANEKAESGREIAAALDAAGIVRGRLIPLAAELTDVQRALVESIAESEVPTVTFPLPKDRTTIRRWLGLEPPTPLEEEVDFEGQPTPLWRALAVISDRVQARPRSPDSAKYFAESLAARVALIDALPAERALRTVDCLLSPAVHGWHFPPTNWLFGGTNAEGNRSAPIRLVTELRAEGGAWAAAWLAAREGVAVTDDFDPELDFNADRTLLRVLAAARGGGPLAPGWDAVLARATPRLAPVELFVECVMALPEGRREPVVLAAWSRERGFPSEKQAAALAVLRVLDSEAIARAALGPNDTPLHPAIARRFAEVAETRPGVARALAERLAKAPKVRPLQRTSRTHPIDEASLDAPRKAQLAAVRKSDPDNFADAEMVEDLAHQTIVDEHGTPAFDAWTYATDSGVFFTVGTTTVVAHVIQDHVELAQRSKSDPGLVAGLAAALRGPVTAAEKPAAEKKPAAKKPRARR